MKLSKIYEPQAYEGEIYDLWLASGAFEPRRTSFAASSDFLSTKITEDGSKDQPFAIIMPPPNANAKLHIGQATYVKQDLKARYRRLKGDRVLYLPGADHAGFETWYVFEKYLAKNGKSKFDFTDKELYEMTYEFVMENIGMAKLTYKQLGLSCAWDYFTFMLDEKITKGVNKIFKRMWDEGLVYRGERLVNYCTYHQTSFSDIEVEYEERKTPLYYLKYGPFEVATTRPETIMGDTAVAVNPKDERYLSLVGEEVKVEALQVLTDGKRSKVKVVADEAVDPEFGTGAVKVTPAHSFEDGEIAERHKLLFVEVIGKDGLMGKNAGKYAGMTVLEAREAVASDLKLKGLVVKVDEDYENRVGVCYKCHTVIEPMLMEQWFVRMKPLAEKAIEAIEADEIKFRPAKRKEIGLDYLKNIRDWNISRQIPWGIRIPAFYNEELDEWVYDESEDDEIKLNGKTYRRDGDVFDTWMSSTQFPYLALGYDVENPENSAEEFKDFFPTAWLQHGREIFNFWGLRMIMMALWNVDNIPFKTLYVNGNIRGEDGKKMSKSLGNTISAEDILDEYGSDAMRMGMIAIDTTAGADKAFDRSKMVLGRNFANKLWNIARFVENLLDGAKLKSAADLGELELKTPADHWIIFKLNEAKAEISKRLDKDEFGEAFGLVYDVVWNSLADWYVEAVKNGRDKNPSPQSSPGGEEARGLGVLVFALETVLKLAHPFAPFVTEAIWQGLGFGTSRSEPSELNLSSEDGGVEASLLVTESWPNLKKVKFSKEEVKDFEEVIRATEFARKVKAYVGNEIEVVAKDANLAELSSGLAKLNSADNLVESLNVPSVEGWSLMISGENLAKYRSEIGKRIDEVQARIKNLEARLNNSAYVKRAPKELVAETKDSLVKLKEELGELKGE